MDFEELIGRRNQKDTRVKAGIRVEAPQTQQLEMLTAIVVPKKILMDDSCRDNQRVVNYDYGAYFDSCALNLCPVFMNVYAPQFEFTRTIEKGQVQYAITHDSVAVRYILRGADRFWSPEQPEGGSNDISGILTVQQPTLNLEQASTFVQAALKYNLLDYQEWKKEKFGVVHHGMNGKVKMEGITLLQYLGIKPEAAAEFWQVMSSGRYQYKEFTPEEQAILFSESAKE